MWQGPLPAYCTEERDSLGRTFYSNHMTRETTWDRPVAVVPPPPPPVLPPPYGATPATVQYSQKPTSCVCTPRLTFWVAALLGWTVWIFGVSAGVDDNWFEDSEFSAADDETLDNCDDDAYDGDFCALYEAFTAMQIIATVLVSFAMLFLMIGLFRPAMTGCCTTRALGIVGGVLMIAYAFFQMLAFVLVIAIEKTEDDLGTLFSGYDVELGATFGVAVVGCLIGMLNAGVLLTFARSAGDGPLYRIFHDCMVINDANSRPGGGAWNQQYPQHHAAVGQPPAMVAAQPPAAAAVPPAAAAAPPAVAKEVDATADATAAAGETEEAPAPSTPAAAEEG